MVPKIWYVSDNPKDYGLSRRDITKAVRPQEINVEGLPLENIEDKNEPEELKEQKEGNEKQLEIEAEEQKNDEVFYDCLK
jgi:hypothetical protein